MLPAARAGGASFPLALAALVRPGQDPGRLVGGVYAANTLGAIAGSLGIGLFLVAQLGSQRTQQLLVALSVVAGVLMLAPGGAARRSRAHDRGSPRRWLPTATAAVVGLAAIAGAVGLPPVPGVLVAFGRVAPLWVGAAEITYVGEGLNAFVAVSETPTGVLVYHNSGKVQAGSEGQDLRLQRMLGHLSHLVPKNPKDVLVIGLGAGVTAGAVAIAPSVERVTIIEIEPLVPKVGGGLLRRLQLPRRHRPKVTVHIDDGRHYLLTTHRKFDVITSDPLDPWIKGAATLFTEEFFQTMRRHLAPGGVVTQFVQLYGSNTDAVRSEIGTFIKVFPHTLVFGNLAEGQGYDLVLVGQVEPMSIDADALQARLADPSYKRVAASLRDVGIVSAVDLLGNYAGSAADFEPWLRGATINTDRNLRLQYPGGPDVERRRRRRHLPRDARARAISGSHLYRVAGHAGAAGRTHRGAGDPHPMTRRTLCVVFACGLLAASERIGCGRDLYRPAAQPPPTQPRHRRRNTARRGRRRRLSMAGRHRGRGGGVDGRAAALHAHRARCRTRTRRTGGQARRAFARRGPVAAAHQRQSLLLLVPQPGPSPPPRCLRATAPSARSGRCCGPPISTHPAAPCRAGSCRPPTAAGWRLASLGDGEQAVLRLVDVATGRLSPLEIRRQPARRLLVARQHRLHLPAAGAPHGCGRAPSSCSTSSAPIRPATCSFIGSTPPPRTHTWRRPPGPFATFSRDGRWVVAGYWTSADSNDLWLTSFEELRRTGRTTPRIATVGRPGRAAGTVIGNTLFVETTKGAPNGRVVAVDVNNPAEAGWRDIVPERPMP